jgi:carotenoid cleavage dioxygenase-like enzyme
MTEDRTLIDRRALIGGTLTAAAGAGIALASRGAKAQPPADAAPPSFVFGPPGLYRLEADVRDCEVDGKIPSDLNGAFYRVGPDPQYPMEPGDIPFDGEGHVSMFRIKDGRVHYKSRYVRNDRYLAQDKAGRRLFKIYRNPYMDDPSVKGLSRSTANTHIINHKNMLLALKEDSPPSALDLLTLETVDPNFTFGHQLPSRTFTAHPKIDSETGNMVAFGYEAEGFGSDVVSLFEFTPQGELAWNAKVHVPYVGVLHDFGVTGNHIVIFVIPLAIDEQQMKKGGIHWSWDSTKPTYFGVVRRGGDGSDVRWIEGPSRSATHTMGTFEDGGRIYIDMEVTRGNPFPFMPNRDGSPPDFAAAASFLHRLSADLSTRRPRSYDIEPLGPYSAPLPRQDDRYNTMPYRYGFFGCPDPHAESRAGAGACYVRLDHQTGRDTVYNAGTTTSLAECCFAPKHADAREGEGYVMGVATHNDQNGRSDLVILDAEHLDDGPVAVVKLPMRAVGQVHGYWVPEHQLPA